MADAGKELLQSNQNEALPAVTIPLREFVASLPLEELPDKPKYDERDEQTERLEPLMVDLSVVRQSNSNQLLL
jgi:hypothetical protein